MSIRTNLLKIWLESLDENEDVEVEKSWPERIDLSKCAFVENDVYFGTQQGFAWENAQKKKTCTIYASSAYEK